MLTIQRSHITMLYAARTIVLIQRSLDTFMQIVQITG